MKKLRNNFTSLLVLSLLVLARLASGKTAPEYYHEGATNYVHGKWLQAKSAVTNGLSLFPKDDKLLALNKLLENQSQQQKQDQKQQEQEKQDQKDQKDQESKQDQQQDQQQEQQKKDQQQEQPQQKPGDKQEQEKKGQEQQKPSDKQEQSQEKKPGEEGKDPKEQKEGGNAAQQLLQMTPEQAQRLLEAVKSEEKVMIFTPQIKTNRNNRVLKDW